MVFNIPPDPELAKDLAEERQRDLLEEVEADKLAQEDEALTDNYQPITDSKDDMIDSREENTHVKKD
jgi:hypothetical protein